LLNSVDCFRVVQARVGERAEQLGSSGDAADVLASVAHGKRERAIGERRSMMRFVAGGAAIRRADRSWLRAAGRRRVLESGWLLLFCFCFVLFRFVNA
jgi:hypothetical protein